MNDLQPDSNRPPAVLFQQLEIRHHQCGADGRVRLENIFDDLQNAAAVHAELLGFGMSALEIRRQLWVLSRMTLEIKRYPKLGEKLTLRTYPSAAERLFAVREFAMDDQDGRMILRASSYWLLLAAENFKVLAPRTVLAGLYPEASACERFFPSAPGRLPEEELTEFVGEYVVRRSMIDLNNHLNNAFYLRFVTDALAKQPGTLQVNYLQSCTVGDRLGSSMRSNGREFQVNLRRIGDGKTVFQAAGTFPENGEE